MKNNLTSAAVRVWSYGQRLYVAGGATGGQAYIYNLSGAVVKILPYAAGETVSETLPAGIIYYGGWKEI
ncbi:MAG: hypothetical protein LBL57_09020 [Tannerella sp.]|jgi:hypothetical protein|nr:hypothetical protein [Tannerella sp.]